MIYRYSQITILLILMLRNIQTNVKKAFFIFYDNFSTFKNVFQSAFILIHFDSKLIVRSKTDTFDHDVIDIIFQLQSNNQ